MLGPHAGGKGAQDHGISCPHVGARHAPVGLLGSAGPRLPEVPMALDFEQPRSSSESTREPSPTPPSGWRALQHHGALRAALLCKPLAH